MLVGGCQKFASPDAGFAMNECLTHQKQGQRKMSFERAGAVVAACDTQFAGYAAHLVRHEDRFRKRPNDPRIAADYRDLKAVLEVMARCEMSEPRVAECYRTD